MKIKKKFIGKVLV